MCDVFVIEYHPPLVVRAVEKRKVMPSVVTDRPSKAVQRPYIRGALNLRKHIGEVNISLLNLSNEEESSGKGNKDVRDKEEEPCEQVRCDAVWGRK